MLFEWDDNKNEANIKKHGIDFNDAISIFDDDERLEAIDDRQDYGEERIQVIGQAKPGVLFVAYTWRHGNTRRMISARTASKQEKQLYYSMLGR